MSTTITDVLLTLQRTPPVLEALLGGLPPEITIRAYAPRAFGPYNVLGHLIIGEREDWMPRLRIILQDGETRPFDPFDHTATIDPAHGAPLAELLHQFSGLRAANLTELAALNLSEQDLQRTEGSSFSGSRHCSRTPMHLGGARPASHRPGVQGPGGPA